VTWFFASITERRINIILPEMPSQITVEAMLLLVVFLSPSTPLLSD
jgi:hypothetical protein